MEIDTSKCLKWGPIGLECPPTHFFSFIEYEEDEIFEYCKLNCENNEFYYADGFRCLTCDSAQPNCTSCTWD